MDMDDYMKQLKKNESRRKAVAKKVFEDAQPKAKKQKAKPSALDIFFDEQSGVTLDSKTERALKKPGKDSDKPHLYTTGTNITQQADILMLPTDRGFKNLLVVVDTGTKLMDAVPIMGNLNSDKVTQALKYIYGTAGKTYKGKQPSTNDPPKGTIDKKHGIYRPGLGRILQKPVMLQTDGGPEFKGATDKYLSQNNIVHRTGIPYRSRQQAFVEARNATIAQMLLGRQAQDEIATGETSRLWLDFVWRAIAANNKAKQRQPLTEADIPEEPTCKGQSCELIPVGTTVHRIQDAPRDVLTGKKQVGKFRKGDIRWELRTRKVVQQILKPGNPPLYRLSSLDDDKQKKMNMKVVAYTRAQLQVVSGKPEPKKTATGQAKYIVERIVKYDKKTRKYEVKWSGYPSSANTMEPSGNIGGFDEEKAAARKKAR